jgi:hypothetical protein
LAAAANDPVAVGLAPDEQKRLGGLMKLDAAAWAFAEQLTDEEVVTLIRFFTRAEMELPGWEAGKRSPVIPLVKILKSRDGFGADLRKWIKSNTDNRYLPNGSVL